MPRIKKRYIVLIALTLITIGTLVWVRAYVFRNVAAGLHERIQSLDLSGFNVRYDSIRVDWRRNVIEIDNLVLEKRAYDTTCVHPEFISVGKVRAEGISLLQLIFRNILSFKSVHLDRPRLVLRQNSFLKLDSAAQRKNRFTLNADRVSVRSADLTYTDSARCETITSLRSHFSITGLNLDFHADQPLAYKAESVIFDSLEVKAPSQFYTFRIRRAEWNNLNKAFRADSIAVIPDLGKSEFGRRHGFEIDRMECFIPSFAVNGLSFTLRDSLHAKATLAEIQFYLKVFRDKRLPFVKKEKLLPVGQLRDLPFAVVIDSLKVINSFVQYEEFAEGSSAAGGIFFDNLNATLRNVSNVADSGRITLRAHARLFGQGDLTLDATFPFETNRRSSVAGSIVNFSLPELNPILTPATQLEVESGEMKALLFSFTFNTVRSDGQIELNYENLKLISFKAEEKSNGTSPEKDNLKTFIMNTFVFRKNMTDDMPEEKRKGTIMYLRDDSRSVFNFWSKSLISGIKSAYNLDKAEAKQSSRESKKEERLSRREGRRQKTAEKKKG